MRVRVRVRRCDRPDSTIEPTAAVVLKHEEHQDHEGRHKASQLISGSSKPAQLTTSCIDLMSVGGPLRQQQAIQEVEKCPGIEATLSIAMLCDGLCVLRARCVSPAMV